MKYIIDNDLHIHSKLSSCSKDPEQTTQRIFRYAEENELKTICIADHFWDEKAEKLGAGIEINASDMEFDPEEENLVLRPFRTAKKCGCKFYCASDAHHPRGLDKAKMLFEKGITLLELTENDKFII